MDQLKYIKIQNADSTWSEQIPISHNPSQIFFSDDESLQTKITNIENALDTKTEDLTTRVNNIAIQAFGYAIRDNSTISDNFNVHINFPGVSNNFSLLDGTAIMVIFRSTSKEGTLSFTLFKTGTTGAVRLTNNIKVFWPTYISTAGEEDNAYLSQIIPHIEQGELATFVYSAADNGFVYTKTTREIIKNTSYIYDIDNISQDSVVFINKSSTQTQEASWPDSSINYFIVETITPSYSIIETRIQRAWTTSGVLYSRFRYVGSNNIPVWSSWSKEVSQAMLETKLNTATVWQNGQMKTTDETTGQEVFSGSIITIRKLNGIITLAITGNRINAIPSGSESNRTVLYQLPAAYRPSTTRNYETFLTAQHFGTIRIDATTGEVSVFNIKQISDGTNVNLPTTITMRVNIMYIQ